MTDVKDVSESFNHARTGLLILGVIGVAGLVLHTVARHFQELDLQLQTVSEEREDRGQD